VKTNPGEGNVYSDLGFVALGYVLECVFNASLDLAFEQQIATPLGLPSLRFGTDPHQRNLVAPTEQCPWRKRLIVGEVHDQNAWVMGGIAGHAGLFGTANDVVTLGQSLLRSYAGNPLANDPVNTNVLRHFWAYRNTNQSTWALGWDRPSDSGSLAGRLLSRQALGHLAFTGCSVWIDPVTQTQVVMLSNRIHPVVKNDPRFRQLRPDVMDAALRGLNY
jgi:serine-type D-Ala-D-Ala carboxypeptidase